MRHVHKCKVKTYSHIRSLTLACLANAESHCAAAATQPFKCLWVMRVLLEIQQGSKWEFKFFGRANSERNSAEVKAGVQAKFLQHANSTQNSSGVEVGAFFRNSAGVKAGNQMSSRTPMFELQRGKQAVPLSSCPHFRNGTVSEAVHLSKFLGK
jgi:hypothetical protein